MPCKVTVAVSTALAARCGGTGCYQAGQNVMASAAAIEQLRQLGSPYVIV